MKRIALTLVCLLALGACGPAPLKHYYQLTPLPAARPAVAEPLLAGSLRIDPVEVDTIYNDLRIIYRTSPVELNYYAYDFWVGKPAKLLADALLAYCAQRNLARRVLPGISADAADYSLKAHVTVLEEIDEGAAEWARLQVELVLVDAHSGRVLARQQHDRREKMAPKAVAGLVLALSRLLSEELSLFVSTWPTAPGR
jgi:ABC-type uncharacterized transport system auxiliary subunit